MKNYLSVAIAAILVSPLVALADTHGKTDGAHKAYTECAAVRMKELNIKHVEKNKSEDFTQVPEGWTVVGGTGGEGHPKLLICR